MRSVFVDTQASPGLRAQVECAGLDDWRLRLRECVVPDAAACSGASLAELSFPARFGCVILEIERNGIVITALRPEVRVYPGDKLLLLGEDAQVEAAAQSLVAARAAVLPGDTFRGSVLETFAVPQAAWCGQTLAALGIGHRTGTRIVGIRRGTRQIIAPSGEEVLLAGDNLLVNGTLAEIAAFRRWLQESATTVQA